MNYTAEQVESHIACLEARDMHAEAGMLRDYAALLRERESASAGVTDEMIERAARAMCRKFDPPSSLDEMATCDKWRRFADEARCCLEAVMPMLASRNRDAYEGAREDFLDWKGRAQRAEATLRSLGYTGIEANEPPMLASARVPDGCQLVPIDPTGEMIEKGTDQHKCVQGESWYTDPPLSENDCIAIYKAMLAAAGEPNHDA